MKNIGENIHNVLNYDVGKGLSDSITNIGKGISGKLEILNRDVTDIGKGLSEKWTGLISGLHLNHRKISSETPVAELRAMLIEELALDANKKQAKEIAMNTNVMKEQVA